MSPYAGVLLGLLLFAVSAVLVWWFSRRWATTADQPANPSAGLPSSPEAPSSGCSSACSSSEEPVLRLARPPSGNSQPLNSFWPFCLALTTLAAAVLLLVFSVGMLRDAVALRRDAGALQREQVSNDAHTLFLQQKLLHVQQQSLKTAMELHESLKALAGD